MSFLLAFVLDHAFSSTGGTSGFLGSDRDESSPPAKRRRTGEDAPTPPPADSAPATDAAYWRSVSKLGLLADIQYADIPDGSDFSGEQFRRYRNSKSLAEKAVEQRFTRKRKERKDVDHPEVEESEMHCEEEREPAVQALINLGDIVDAQSGTENFIRDLARVNAVLDRVGVPVLDLVGNHELTCCPRSVLCNHLRPKNGWRETEWRGRPPHTVLAQYSRGGGALYYAKTVCGGRFRLLFLDAFVEAVMGYEDWEREASSGGRKRTQARSLVV